MFDVSYLDPMNQAVHQEGVLRKRLMEDLKQQQHKINIQYIKLFLDRLPVCNLLYSLTQDMFMLKRILMGLLYDWLRKCTVEMHHCITDDVCHTL